LFITFSTLDEQTAINTKVPRQDTWRIWLCSYVLSLYVIVQKCMWIKRRPRGQKSKQLQLNSIAWHRGWVGVWEAGRTKGPKDQRTKDQRPMD